MRIRSRGLYGSKTAMEKAKTPYLKALVALAKKKRGEKLTDNEEVILAYLVHAGGCHACNAPARPTNVTALVHPEVMN